MMTLEEREASVERMAAEMDDERLRWALNAMKEIPRGVHRDHSESHEAAGRQGGPGVRFDCELTTGDGVPMDVAEHLFDVVRTRPPPQSAVHANQ
jgi:hypothetical protein